MPALTGYFDGARDILFTVDVEGDQTLRKVDTSNAQVTTLLDVGSSIGKIWGLAAASDGNYLYIPGYEDTNLWQVNLDEDPLVPITIASGLNKPSGVALLPDNSAIFVSDEYRIYLVDLLPDNPTISILAGSDTDGTDDGIGTNARFHSDVDQPLLSHPGRIRWCSSFITYYRARLA